jgi:hypothetical protein
MERYRIHRIKDAPRESFRWAAHMGGLAVVKPRDYLASEEIEAASVYAAWQRLTEEGRPLRPGDLLEAAGRLQITKYIGFEPAQWYVAEAPNEPGSDSASLESNPELHSA